ncbi:hypothetical protein [Thermogemmatispora carboxidivorans]|uniref:hypothetical protein n=1 Tax=Thermogemmatispora carboxidivorans TaxID=1382306 RepID=UPI0012DE086C|nr:hypothetical protein [Thermogemmatispora carboxidivorans]
MIRIILYLSKGEIESIQLVVCSVLVRPQEYYYMTDFGAFRRQPEHYAPGAVRFLIVRMPGRIEAIVKRWYALIQQKGEGSS